MSNAQMCGAVLLVERANERRSREEIRTKARFARVFSVFSLSRQTNRQLRRLSNTESNTWFIQRIVDKIIP